MDLLTVLDGETFEQIPNDDDDDDYGQKKQQQSEEEIRSKQLGRGTSNLVRKSSNQLFENPINAITVIKSKPSMFVMDGNI